MGKAVFLSIFVLYCSLNAQYKWEVLSNAPSEEFGRFEDMVFVNENVGYVIQIGGAVYKTTDGGNSWNQVYQFNGVPIRCIGFADEDNGWIGSIGEYDSNDYEYLFRTRDGGINWEPVTNIPSPEPAGLCGIFVVDKSTIYASGRYSDSPTIIKSEDGGETWSSKSLSNAAGLVDIFFFNPDSGFAVGSIGESPDRGGIIFGTEDGGNTWRTVKTIWVRGISCWKISFPSKRIGYVSYQMIDNDVYYLKTTDGGKTWLQNQFRAEGRFSAQGIGFITPNIGWIGSWPGADMDERVSYETTNGGRTWKKVDYAGVNVNRIRVLNDNLAYAIGTNVYRISKGNITEVDEFKELVEEYKLRQNYPNPFNPATKINYEVAKTNHVTIKVYDSIGKEVATLVNDIHLPGNYTYEFDASSFSSGVYYYTFKSGNFTETKKMVLVK